jgi:undecaprenyl diphosphate synthase
MAHVPAPSGHSAFGSGGVIPNHVAIIMDGNGRWATARGLPRSAGHQQGVEALRRTVEAAGELGIKYLTVFSFSTENWRRPAKEVSILFDLLRAYLEKDLRRLKSEGVHIRVIGRRAGLPQDIEQLVSLAEAETRENSSAFLTIAFNYGGRDEIFRAAQALAREASGRDLDPDTLTESDFENYLDTVGLPQLDLLIRTSGEYRLSNFLLWQAAYAELYFTDVLWPDFGRSELESAIERYRQRERRYGAVGPGAI